jgi:hypothetical protein
MILFSSLTSKVFFTMLHIWLGLHHPLTLDLSYCICGQPLDAMGIHFLHCAQGGERMVSHDIVQDAFASMRDAFASIAKDMGFHVLHKQTHILLLPTF